MSSSTIKDKSLAEMYLYILSEYTTAEIIEKTNFWSECYELELNSEWVDDKFRFKVNKHTFYYNVSIVLLDISLYSTFDIQVTIFQRSMYRKLTNLFKMIKNREDVIEDSKKRKVLIDTLPLGYQRMFKIDTLK